MIGDNVKMIRNSKGMTVRGLAGKCGMSHGYISDIENGRGNPTIDKLQLIADALEVSIKNFIDDEEIPGENKELLSKISKLDKKDKELIKSMIERFKKS